MSVAIAFAVAAAGMVRLVAERLALTGALWRLTQRLDDNFALLGIVTCAILAVAWGVSLALWRARESMT